MVTSEVEFPRRRGVLRRRSRSYLVRAAYDYEVAGRAHRGDRVRVGAAGHATYDHAREERSRYPVGQPVTVHYDPVEPGRAVLMPGGGWRAWLPSAVGGTVLVALFGPMLGFFAWLWWMGPDPAPETAVGSLEPT